MVFHRKTIMKIMLVISACLMLISLPSCVIYKIQQYPYYSDKSNFITVHGTLDEIFYHEDERFLLLKDENRVVFIFADMDCESYDLNNSEFEIGGKNFDVLIENGIKEKLSVGDEVEFVTSPKMFGDGYLFPIVALKVGDVVLLDFDTGYENYMNQVKFGRS